MVYDITEKVKPNWTPSNIELMGGQLLNNVDIKTQVKLSYEIFR